MAEITIAARYSLGETLGAGGMGVVYKAIDSHTGDTVAIKQIRQDRATPELIERFNREGEVLRDLDHRNIVKLLASFNADGHHYLVMPYITGGNLSQRIDGAALLVEQVLTMGIDLADALTQAHKCQVIHRDLKPANVLLDADETVYLTDFGLAYVDGRESITSSGAIVGTIDYLPPEAFNNQRPDAKGDLWSLGVMLVEMLTGKNPFARDSILETMWAITSEPLPDLEALAPQAPPPLLDVIYRILEREPAARIVSVRHVGAALEDILRGQPVTATASRFVTPTSETLDNVKHNLPVQTTACVGRSGELDQIAALLLASDHRLVTLNGPGGIGKTRLALEAGQQALPGFADGVFFVELAPLTEAEGIAPAIAEAVGFQFQGDSRTPQQQLLDFLTDKHLLLILDNFEHLSGGSTFVGELLGAAPKVKLLVTSRQRLNMAVETLVTLEYLAFPPEQAAEYDMLPGALQTYTALDLFLQSARRSQPGFDLTADNREGVMRVCRLVHGLPLALVLAASWLPLLSPAEIADEIERSSDFLDAELVDLPVRQRSMRAVFDYSWSLLSENERVILSQISVFRGGFTRAAAQSVTGSTLRSLMNLLNKSLLSRDTATGRYSTHELIRQFGEEKLTASPHNTATRDEHANTYLRLLEQLVVPLRTNGQLQALATIETEFKNIRIAWRRAVAGRSYVLLGAAAESLFHFARMRNRHPDVQPLFEEALAGDHTPASTEERLGLARLLLWTTMTNTGTIATPDPANMTSRLAQAEALLAAPDLAGQGDDERWFITYQYLRLDIAEGIVAALVPRANDLIALAEAKGDRWRLALGHHTRSYINMMIDYEESLRSTLAAYELFKDLGNLSWTALAANNMGVFMLSRRDFDHAETYLDECIAIYHQLGDEARSAHAMCVRGNMNFARGAFERAARDFQQAGPIVREIAYPYGRVLATTGLGVLAQVDGNPDAVRQYIREVKAMIPRVPNAPDRITATIIADSLSLLVNDAADPETLLTQMAGMVRRAPPNPYGWFFLVAVIHALAERGDTRRAVEVAGVLHTKGGLSEGFRHLIQPTLRQARNMLGDEDYEHAWHADTRDYPSLLRDLLDEFTR